MQALGIDVGGSGVKGALVDLKTGELCSERVRFEIKKKVLFLLRSKALKIKEKQ